MVSALIYLIIAFSITKPRTETVTLGGDQVAGTGRLSGTSLENISYNLTKLAKEFNGISSHVVTLTDNSTFAPFPAKDFFKIAKQATAIVNFSGNTISTT